MISVPRALPMLQYSTFQILVPLCLLHFFLRPAIHAATHEKCEAYRKAWFPCGASTRKSPNCRPLTITMNSHHPLFCQKHARLNLARRRSLVLDHRKLVHLATFVTAHVKIAAFPSCFFPTFSLAVCSRPDSSQRSKATVPTTQDEFSVNLMTTGRSYFWRPSSSSRNGFE